MISGAIYYCYNCKSHYLKTNEADIYEDVVLMCAECCMQMQRKIVNDYFIEKLFKSDIEVK